MILVKANPAGLALQAPYHPALPRHASAIGGRWMGRHAGWAFPHKAEPALRALCDAIWAVDGSPDAFATTVDLRVSVDERTPVRRVFLAYEQPIYLVGREIAASLASRRAARPGRGVRFLEGGPCCLEASNTWSTLIPNGAVFIVRAVPIGAIRRFQDVIGNAGIVSPMP